MPSLAALATVATLALATRQAPTDATAPVPEGPVPPAPLETERPVPTPPRSSPREQQLAAWEIEQRRLKLHTGLSGGFAGAMVLTGALLFILPGLCRDPDPEFGCGEIFLPYLIGTALFPLALIPTGTGIYWGVRLHRHKKQQPVARLRPAGGGLVLHF